MIIEFAFIIYKKKWINHICIISVQAGLLCLSPYWARVHRCHIHHICNHNFHSSGREQGMPYSAFSATLDLFYTYGSQSNKRNNAMIRQMKYTIWSLSAKFHVFKLSWHHDIMSSCHLITLVLTKLLTVKEMLPLYPGASSAVSMRKCFPGAGAGAAC